MKKTIIAIVLALAVVLTLSGTVLANGGPHGGYTATTDACAGCHRTHTAANARLLMVASATLCTSCHGAAGSGANTNVDDGKYLSTRDDAGGNWNHGAANTPDNANLLGGGFVTYKGPAITSNHTIGQANTWGQGATDRGTATALAGGLTLQCVSCHDPHGSTNYRIFKTTVNGVAVAVAQVDEAAKDYNDENWGVDQSNICAACHNAYHKSLVSQGSTLDGTTYTHRVDMAWNVVPAGVTVGANNPETLGYDGVAGNGDEVPLGLGGFVMCQTCHVAHGTSATMTALSTNGIPTTDSALLRLNNRGVCQSCHQKQ